MDDLQLPGEFPQNPRDFRGFVIGELHELIVGLHGLKRFHEDRLPCRARSVHHAGNAPPMLGPHRNHETIVPQGDVVFPRFRMARAQNLLQALLDGIARLRDAHPDSPQRR